MNDETIQDLKQFISATVHQATSGMATKEELKTLATKEDLKKLATKEELKTLATKEDLKIVENKIDELSHAVAESIELSNEENDARIADHSRRIVSLESNTA